MKKISNINTKNFVEIIEDEKNVILSFFSDNDKVSKDKNENIGNIDNEKYKIIEVDITKETNIPANFVIKAIPSIIVFENGNPEEQIIGKENIEKFINIIKLEK